MSTPDLDPSELVKKSNGTWIHKKLKQFTKSPIQHMEIKIMLVLNGKRGQKERKILEIVVREQALE